MSKILIVLIASIFISCSGSHKLPSPEFMPGPKAIIYKTKADYFDKVPILLSDDKSTIMGFPDPKDLVKGDNYSLPTPLIKGYLLDNRGLNPNTAFLKYSYNEYVKLDKPPSIERLYDMILDSNPMLEIYDFGQRSDFKDLNEINSIIRKHFRGVKRVK